MDSSNNSQSINNQIEIRPFGILKSYADEKGWPFPYIFELKEECSAIDLVNKIGMPSDKVEAVFVNGIAKPLDEGFIKPGDRVGLIPYGVPGPYRILLGIRKTETE